MPLVSKSLFHEIGRKVSCVKRLFFMVPVVWLLAMYTQISDSLQLPVECPLCKKTDAANHESRSLSPSCEGTSLHKDLIEDLTIAGSHYPECHLYLPALPREQFAKVAQPCCNNPCPDGETVCC